MLRTALRIAIRIAFSGGRRARWRQFAVVSAALIGVSVLLFATGLVRANLAADDVRAARAPFVVDQVVHGPRPAPLHMSMRMLAPGPGESQFMILWLEPGEPGTGPIPVPPGLARLPEPGTMVVSPALARAGLSAEALGSRTSMAGTGPEGRIGREGLVTADERFAYARPAPGRSLGEGGALSKVSRFGNPDPAFRFRYDPVIAFPDPLTFIVALVWLIVLPALIMMVGGSRALSEIRRQRAMSLLRFGVAPMPIRLVLGLETALLALPGCATGLMLYAVAAPRVASIPFSDIVLHPGAVTLPWPLAWGTAALPAVLMGACGASGRLVATPPRRKAVRLWHAIPAMVGFGLMASNMAFSVDDSDRARANLYLGLLLSIVGLPLALPNLASMVGRLLSRSPAASIWMVGKRLRFNPIALTRPAGVVAVLVLLTGASLAIHGRMTLVEPEQQLSWRTASLVLDWRDEKPEDLGNVLVALHDMDGVTVLPVGSEPLIPSAGSPGAGSEQETVVVRSCADLNQVAKLLGTPPCDAAGNTVSRQFAENLFHETYRVIVVDNGRTSVRKSPYSAVIIGPPSLAEADVYRRLGDLPALNLSRFRPVRHPDPQAGLLLGGLIGGSLILLFGAMREVVNRALWYHLADVTVDRLGLADRDVDAVRRITLALPIVLATLVGGIGAILFAVVGHRQDLTVVDVRNIVIAQLLVGTATLAVVFLGMRTVRRR